MCLTIDSRKTWTERTSMDDEWGISWQAGTRYGVDRIGSKAEARRLVADTQEQIAARAGATSQ